MCVRTYACLHLCMQVCMYESVYVHIFACLSMYVRNYVCMHVSIHTYLHTYMHIRMHVHACMHAYIHIHASMHAYMHVYPQKSTRLVKTLHGRHQYACVLTGNLNLVSKTVSSITKLFLAARFRGSAGHITCVCIRICINIPKTQQQQQNSIEKQQRTTQS